MLDALRTAAGTWVAKLLLFMLVISFAIWGISGQMIGGFGSSHVIDGRRHDGVAQGLPPRLRPPDPDHVAAVRHAADARAGGGVRDRPAGAGAAGRRRGARRAGAQARPRRLQGPAGAARARGPGLHGADGTFDRQQFEQVLRAGRHDADDYLRNRQQVAVRQQIVEAISDGLQAPDAFLEAVALYRGEDRTVDYVAVPRSLVEPIEEPGGVGSQDLVRGAQGDLRGAGIPQDRLHQARSGSAGRSRRRSATSR